MGKRGTPSSPGAGKVKRGCEVVRDCVRQSSAKTGRLLRLRERAPSQGGRWRPQADLRARRARAGPGGARASGGGAGAEGNTRWAGLSKGPGPDRCWGGWESVRMWVMQMTAGTALSWGEGRKLSLQRCIH